MKKFPPSGFDIHKKVIAYCRMALNGRLIGQGKIDADRKAVLEWVNRLPELWILHRFWIYDFLIPYAIDVNVAYPEMLKAITVPCKDCRKRISLHGF
jgi:hypothetical protein